MCVGILSGKDTRAARTTARGRDVRVLKGNALIEDERGGLWHGDHRVKALIIGQENDDVGAFRHLGLTSANKQGRDCHGHRRVDETKNPL